MGWLAGYLGLLEQLYGRVLIPSGVWHELQRGGEDDPRITDVLGLDWIEVCQPTNQQLVNVLQTERHLVEENQRHRFGIGSECRRIID
ncbi:hypothetical protein [Laspinema olomoucense]|uniref:Uncharacterized protein n=1 Tax=Laspinema olomoucense D3b TaxID=2953688 RepID=A0ABT2N242_9CYAN|nr:hypothetical protein [Laspinema sp. D3b]MCT7976758.1 hypothetical protein [Laspinema sp. D3b]